MSLIPKPIIKDTTTSLQRSLKPASSYEVIKRKTSSRGNSLIKSLRSPKEMFILKEILDKPLSLR